MKWLIDESPNECLSKVWHMPVRKLYHKNSRKTVLFPFAIFFIWWYIIADTFIFIHLQWLKHQRIIQKENEMTREMLNNPKWPRL